MVEKTGPQLVLEHNLLYQIVADRLFWEKNPAFLDLKDDGEEAHHKVVEHVLQQKPLKDCTGCGTVRGVMRPFMAKFTQVIANLDQAGAEQFIAYISDKRGYRPQPIIVYHKDDGGRTHELRL